MPRTSTTKPKGSGASKGKGWGGPARGKGKPPCDTAASLRMTALRDDAERKAERERRALEMEDVIYDLAFKADSDATRLTAADKLLDRLKGKAVAKNELTGADGKDLPASLTVTFVQPG